MRTYDYVVVGSGFGGAVAALRLAECGKEVLVLERGRRWRGKNISPAPGDPPSTPFPQLGDTHFFWGRQLWHPTRQRLGLFDIKQMINLQGLLGAGVGGGSLIWANVVIDAPEHIFHSGWPADITRERLEEYYRRAEAFLRPAYVPGTPGVPTDCNSKKGNIWRAEALKRAAQALGAHWSPVRVAINFADDAHPQANGFGTARQMGCDFSSCATCSAGCSQSAKNSVDLSYIAMAESRGAEVRPLHEVTEIEPFTGKGGGYKIKFKRYDEDGRVAEYGQLIAQHVILACGTFGTNQLLLKMKKRGLMPSLSDALGTRFSVNGNVLGGALKEGTPASAIAQREIGAGPQIASMIDFGDFVIEDFANPSWTRGIIGASQLGRITGFINAHLGRRPNTKDAVKDLLDLLVYVGVGRDRTRGRLRLNAFGKLTLTWPGGIQNEPVVRALNQAMSEIARVQGRKFVPDVFSIFGRPLTYHPLGGCPMAESVEQGVVDSLGRVFGYPGLYIADGSIVPTSLGRNPAFTIAALSERIMEHIVSKPGR